MERDQLERTEDHGDDAENSERCDCPGSSAVRCMVEATDTRHRQGAGVSNAGWKDRRRQKRTFNAVQAHHGAREDQGPVAARCSGRRTFTIEPELSQSATFV